MSSSSCTFLGRESGTLGLTPQGGLDHAGISILGFSTQSLTSLHVLHIEVQVVRDLSHKHGLVAGGALLFFQHRQHLLYRLLLVVGPDLWE